MEHTGRGEGELTFGEGGDVASGPAGTIYVVEQGNHRVQAFRLLPQPE